MNDVKSRLTMDAAQKRLMTSKKTNPLLEEEVRVAKARFEETQEDVQMRMESISQNEDVYFQFVPLPLLS